MTTTAHVQSLSIIMARPAPFGHDVSGEQLSPSRRLFKKHKTLPHPARNQRPALGNLAGEEPRPTPGGLGLVVDTAAPPQRHVSLPNNSPTLRHQSRRIRSGPMLPPTPPAHSRTSSGSHSIQRQSPPPEVIALDTRAVASASPSPLDEPSTPTNQHSPPTPDITPPQPLNRPKAKRPVFMDRTASKATSESRTESFRTAREEPWASEEDDSKSTVRPGLPSVRTTSQSTVRQLSRESRKPRVAAVGLGLGMDSTKGDDDLTPRTKGEFNRFDGDWASPNEVEQVWDDNLGRKVTVRKEKQPRQGAQSIPQTPVAPQTPNMASDGEVLEDNVLAPTNATQALRSLPLQERMATNPTPRGSVNRDTLRANAAASETSINTDRRRHSGMSTRSNVSTVVEAFLVGASPAPQRRQTLRHVRKRGTLRDSLSDASPQSSAPSSTLRLDDTTSHPPLSKQYTDQSSARHGSAASTTTFNSISSKRARREVWKNGAIPVVVVPERRSSNKPSRTPSLRSTSSQRSKRSQSVSSVPRASRPRSNDPTPVFERPGRRGRAASESDGSDPRTIDFPPAIPTRSSSLSAPTSRNNSRAGSMTAESLKSRNALLSQESPEVQEVPSLVLRRAPSFEAGQEDHIHHRHFKGKGEVDHHGDPFFGKRLSTQNTPFSIGSVDTNGTAPELAEATAVNLYPHQNSSVLVVDHTNNKSSTDSEESLPAEDTAKQTPQKPKIMTTAPDSEFPVTPPQPKFSLDEVDSPLRNPRDPPQPPVINFIPATPSGLTPHHEKSKMLGNYFEQEEAGNEAPARGGMAIVRRALSGRGRHSVSYPPSSSRLGTLARSFSLSRSLRRHRELPSDLEDEDLETPPAERNKLHPHWRPATYHGRTSVDDDYFPPYPPNSRRPKRSLSERMKRTFALHPPEDDFDPDRDVQDEPDRRTISRSPSGNLRVVKRRNSLDSLEDYRPATAPDGPKGPRAPLRQRNWDHDTPPERPERKRRFSLSGTFEELQGLPRRFSEKRREKRTQELRAQISGPREVRDGVGDVIRRGPRHNI
ncbi:hypothetical protein F5X68DRAFT_5641 [Plectosphaerella plurivora]|uniref:Uncharacterized protein n=1 Tax=Plectosphaerella plurivora TaxID=936078 RepID=A0A9P8VQ39_9PEZI|nr:hypothetical protein F5X68DRAFT_5641 [Plectosphaerella plurivora]